MTRRNRTPEENKRRKGYVNCFRLPTSGVCRIFRSFSKR